MIERFCDEISWRNALSPLSRIKKDRHLQVFSPLSEWHLYCLQLCVMHRSEPVAQFLRPPRVGGSRTSRRNTIVGANTGADDDGLAAFLSMRGRLFGIAYRMLKSAAEAEEIVQDTWMRWQMTDRSAVQDAAAFLATTTRRLAINVIQSARSCREISIRPSLRESVDTIGDAESEAERSESLQSAVLVLLEKLTPSERSAYVLREAFGYSYREIAKILRLEETNTRQLVTRARRHLAEGRRATVNSAEQRCFLAAFVAAAREDGLKALESFLCRDRLRLGRKDEWPARAGSTVVVSGSTEMSRSEIANELVECRGHFPVARLACAGKAK